MEHFNSGEHWSDERWKSCLATVGGSKRKYQYCCGNSGTIFYPRALQGHSGHNLIDPTLQDNVMIQRRIFHHIYHIGCAFNFHSIINNVKGINPAPHIHEHLRYTIMATALRTPSRITTSCLSTLR